MGYFAIILAALIWGLLAHVDRFLVNEKGNSHTNNVKALIIFSTLIAGGAMLIIKLATNGFQWPSLPLVPILLSIGAALFYIGYTFLQLSAYSNNDASVVIAFNQLSPVFTYAAALIFLGESLTLQQIIGAVIVIIATLFLVVDFDKKDQKGKHKVRALLLMLSALVCFTIYSLLLDQANAIGDYNANMIYFQVGTILPGLVFICIKSFRRTFIDRIRTNGKKYLTLNIFNEVGNSTAVLLRSFAIMFIPLALLDTLDLMGMAIFTLIFGFLGTKLLPKFFDEDLSRTAVLQKLVCISVSLVGVVIIFL